MNPLIHIAFGVAIIIAALVLASYWAAIEDEDDLP